MLHTPVSPLTPGRLFRAKTLWYELRWSVGWSWLVPLLLIVGSLALARLTYVPLYMQRQADGPPLTAEQIAAFQEKDPGPDYVVALRNDLERFLPPLSLFLTLGLLAREWQQGTLAQLALRRPSLVVLFGRLCIVLLYLVILMLLASWGAYSLLRKPPADVTVLTSMWEMLRTVFPSMLLLIAIGLCTVHLTVSSIAGYLLPVALWLINLLACQFMTSGGQKHDVVLYLLFGWYYHDQALNPDNWWIGKLILLVVALVLLGLQLPLVRQEARFIRNTGD
ncbi:hypothetical protein EI42_04745 [Thermosporothrix hazakensis]|jgi:hypothetical protein|uniref:ABC-2 family transporter n=1 Tax=Thermosporothrix hazakensis TaxID=644383 RepID=A0A326U0R4_THEHA|nr:hypothetical protein [Thermosporothrix hazakensis]PZW24054.1 hypothetical protein EI42_04745 [Thermosporothrix hazakensis]GCE50267.1 hypothetical protein KTH_51360 [Thermosporothrix hazakensis]